MFLAQDPDRYGAHGPHDDFWFMPVGRGTSSGIRVSPSTALAVTAIFACAKVLGETYGVAPLILYRRDGKKKERATKHPLYRVLHQKPNRWQTAFQWKQMMQWHLALRYNAYSEKLFDRAGNISELIPLHPDYVTVERFAGGDGVVNFRYRYRDPRTGQERILVREEMFHLRGLSTDGIEGFSPLDVQSESIGEAIAAQRFGATRMRNDARSPGVIEWPGHFNTDDDRKKFRTSYQDSQTGANAGKTTVLERGMVYKELGIKNTDLQYIELRKTKNYEIAAMYRMPPHKIQILDRATNNNIEHQGLEFVTDTMMPWFKNGEEEMSVQLLRDDEQEEFFVETLVEGLLRGDSKSRAMYYRMGIQDGWLVRNEARERENLNPLPGLDKPLVPMNMSGAGATEDPEREERDPADGQDDDDAGAARLQVLQGAAIDRVLRKESEMVARIFQRGTEAAADELQDAYGKHQGFVASVMAVSAEVAAMYCADQLEMAKGAGKMLVTEFEAVTRSKLERIAHSAAGAKGD